MNAPIDTAEPTPEAAPVPTEQVADRAPASAPQGVPIYDISGPEPQLGSMAPEEVEAAVASGQYSLPKGARVPVVTPEGEAGDIDAAEAPDAFQNGYKYATPKVKEAADNSGAGAAFKSFLTGVPEGAVGPLGTLANKAVYSNKELQAQREYHPIAHMAGEMVGFGLSAWATAGVAPALEALGLGAVEGLNVTSKLGAAALRGAVETAALTGSDDISKMMIGDPKATVSNAIADMGLSSVLGGTMGLGFGVLGMGAGKLGTALGLIRGDADLAAGNILNTTPPVEMGATLKTLLHVVGGVSPEYVDAYLANAEKLVNVPEKEALDSYAHEHVSGIFDKLAEDKITAKEASKAFDELKNTTYQLYRENGRGAAEAEEAAELALDRAVTNKNLEIKMNAESKAPAVAEMVEKLQQKVFDGSDKALDILDSHDDQISLKPLYGAMREAQGKLAEMASPQSMGMAEQLQKHMDTLGSVYGDQLSGSSAKQVLKDLRNKVPKWNIGATEEQTVMGGVYKNLQGVLDGELKKNVAYKVAMKGVAGDKALLDKLGGFENPEKALLSILSLKNESSFVKNMPLLRELEERMGVKFTTDLDVYASKNLRASKLAALPEQARYERAAQALDMLQNPNAKEAIESVLTKHPEYEAMQKANSELASSQAAKEAISPLTPGNVQSKMASVMKGKSIENAKAFENIPGINGMSIPEVLKLAHLRDMFEKDVTNGSRMTNMIAGVGKTIGGLAGGVPGYVIGEGLGHIVGGVIDKKGPTMVRDFLDRYLEKYGSIPKMAGTTAREAELGMTSMFHSGSQGNPEAFKTVAKYMGAVETGYKILKTGANAVLKGGAAWLPQQMIPSKEKTEKLDQQLKDLQANPKKLTDLTGQLGHYLPNHAVAATSMLGNIVNMANQTRPQNPKMAPLDGDMPLSSVQKAKWNRTLQIAQQPLIAFQHIQDGTLLPQDVQTLQSCYPEYYGEMAKQLMNSIHEHLSAGNTIPYDIKQSMSLFLGQPLDSTLLPASIMAIQGSFVANQQPQPGPAKGSTTKLAKAPDLYKTAEQARDTRLNA